MTEPTNPREFTLSDLAPEPLIFRDGGTVYEVRTKADFGALELARFNRLMRRYQAALNTLQAEQTEAQEATAAAELEQIIDTVVSTLIPDLAADRIKRIRISQKAAFLDWWRQEQTPAPTDVVGEVAGR